MCLGSGVTTYLKTLGNAPWAWLSLLHLLELCFAVAQSSLLLHRAIECALGPLETVSRRHFPVILCS